MKSKFLMITNIHFGNPEWGTENEIFAEVSCVKTGKMCLKSHYTTIMEVIRNRDFDIVNEHEVIDLLNIMLNIDYSKYGTEKFWRR